MWVEKPAVYSENDITDNMGAEWGFNLEGTGTQLSTVGHRWVLNEPKYGKLVMEYEPGMEWVSRL